MQPGLIEPGCYTKGSRVATMEAITSSPESRGFWPAPNFIWADKRPPVRGWLVWTYNDRVAFGLLQISFGQTKGHPFRWPFV